MVTSAKLLSELERTLARPKFLLPLQKIGASPWQIVENLQNVAEIVISVAFGSPVCRDPDDDEVIGCALAAKCRFVVSGDVDLLTLTRYRDVEIINPSDALRVVEDSRK
jgi:putative PIN family toxin of toxin-antitoxin system